MQHIILTKKLRLKYVFGPCKYIVFAFSPYFFYCSPCKYTLFFFCFSLTQKNRIKLNPHNIL